MYKLLITVPTFENISPETFKSIYDLTVPEIVSEVDFEFVRGYDCARARNEAAKIAVENGYDYLLMVDSDIVLPKDTLISFFDRDTGSVLLGSYPRKHDSGKSELFDFGQGFGSHNRYSLDTIRKAPDRVKVMGGGLGCALIDVDVFKEVRKPWFVYVTYPNGEMLSEDLYFCESVNRLVEAAIYADTRVICGHVTKYVKYE